MLSINGKSLRFWKLTVISCSSEEAVPSDTVTPKTVSPLKLSPGIIVSVFPDIS